MGLRAAFKKSKARRNENAFLGFKASRKRGFVFRILEVLAKPLPMLMCQTHVLPGQ